MFNKISVAYNIKIFKYIGNMCVCCLNPVNQQKLSGFQMSSRTFSVNNILCNNKNHYHVLGISTTATQTDIKTAYYKLSMLYHPDKNKGCEDAANKFRDITSAYEVLGNFKHRKLYDKGIIQSADSKHQANYETVYKPEDDDPQTKFYKQHMKRTEKPHASGRTPIYNFDEWTESHYGKTFERDRISRLKKRAAEERKRENVHGVKNEMVLIGILCTCFGIMFIILKIDDARRDQPILIKKETNHNDKQSVR